ncbi:single-stranded DNA-binding protein [Nocardioides sp. Root1257]|uniref:single-stranded DNA-binding protein n=1 Tax=unclassified Nocardioides TaxID=2615069 RepID=UPI0006F3584D|nr:MULTISPECIES: single-stranded DNA-binding protein [unclassified Nocardioides]KQW49748.1 single-stranded DNA-binding protein [Nocardioides sp. Root1257]KRC50389.1 single-stranded DNA-binding protein [Nocardioides sp. Root224]
MPAQQKNGTAVDAAVNEVRLVGRVSQAPEERVLPSGDVLWTFRVVVPRPDASGRSSVDALECAAWTSRARRSVASWQPDDVVEVSGAMRRRFFRTGGGAASRVEVEMTRGRLIRRAGSG